MRKTFIPVVCVLMMAFHSFSAAALGLEQMGPDDSYLTVPGRNVSDDIAYLRGVAQAFSDRYVVTEERQADISEIDRFYTALSSPISLEELDTGQINLSLDGIGTKEYRRFLKDFKTIGGAAGYTAEFEPAAYFRVYRDITLVGGYVIYHKTYDNPNDAYWQYICGVENMTKEKVPYETRMTLLERTRQLSDYADSDVDFKVFILKDNKLDSMFCREDSI